MFVRIRYLTYDGMGEPRFDSYVTEYPITRLFGIIEEVLRLGFTMKATVSHFPDEEERIMPGAIMSITPCDERGYSKHDKEQMKQREEQRRKDQPWR